MPCPGDPLRTRYLYRICTKFSRELDCLPIQIVVALLFRFSERRITNDANKRTLPLDLSSVRYQKTGQVLSESMKIILGYPRTTTTGLTVTIKSVEKVYEKGR